MAAHHGNEGTVKIGANALAEVQKWTYDEEEYSTIEKVSMGDTDVDYLTSGITRGSGTVDCLWDETDTNGQESLTIGGSATLVLYPEGAATGDQYYTGTVRITNISMSSGASEAVMRNFSFVGSLTKSTV